MTEIGQIIREERKRRGLSQEQLARLINLDRSSISKIENNKQVASYELLEDIIEALSSPRLRLETLGSAIPCMYLNNVDFHPVATQQKAIEEMEEALAELKKLNLINKRTSEDLTKVEKEALLEKTMMELQDVNICMNLILISLSEEYDLDLERLEELSRQKMISRGYRLERMEVAG